MNEENQKIIELLAQGLTVKQVAHEVKANVRTLEQKILRWRKKLKCDNITQLVVKMLTVDNETED